jgi:hypothetical protein
MIKILFFLLSFGHCCTYGQQPFKQGAVTKGTIVTYNNTRFEAWRTFKASAVPKHGTYWKNLDIGAKPTIESLQVELNTYKKFLPLLNELQKMKDSTNHLSFIVRGKTIKDTVLTITFK